MTSRPTKASCTLVIVLFELPLAISHLVQLRNISRENSENRGENNYRLYSCCILYCSSFKNNLFESDSPARNALYWIK